MTEKLRVPNTTTFKIGSDGGDVFSFLDDGRPVLKAVMLNAHDKSGSRLALVNVCTTYPACLMCREKNRCPRSVFKR